MFSVQNTIQELNYPKRKMVLSSILFFISFTLLLVFLNLFRNGLIDNFLFFWILILTIFSCILYKVFNIKKTDKGFLILTLFEIITIIFLLHIIRITLSDYQVFFSDDGYTIIDAARYIQQNQYSVFAINSPDYARWFIVPILYDLISQVCNIDLFKTALFTPSVISSIGSIFVYIFGMTFYKKNKVALLAYLLFGAFIFYDITHSGAHPEFMAFIFMFMGIYAFFKTKSEKNKILWSVLTIVFILLTSAANYTTAFFVTALFIVMFITSIPLNLRKINVNTKKMVNYGFVILAITAFFAYAVYIGVSAFESTVLIGSEINVPTFRDSGSPEIATVHSLKDNIIGKGQLFFLALFGIITFLGLLKSRNDPEKFGKSYFLGLWGLIGVLLYGTTVILKLGGIYLGPRVMIFFYPFILLVASFYIFDFKLDKRKITAVMFICFIIINIASFDFIPGNFINADPIPVEYTGAPEIASIHWYNASYGYVIGGDTVHSRAFNYYNGKFDTALENPQDLLNLRNYKLVYFKSKSFDYKDKAKIEKAVSLYNNTNWLQEVYDNGWWQIYKTT